MAGTGTEVGKTWVSARVLEALHDGGLRVAARKPVQSFAPGTTEPTDAEVLAAATGADPHEVCPGHRWYALEMAPPMAAERLGMAPPQLATLVDELSWPTPAVDVGLVETAGGTRSPIAIDGDTVDLARAIEPDAIVLVADSGLGTINLVRLSTVELAPWPVLVHLNRFDDHDTLHLANRDWLESTDRLRVTTAIDAVADFASARLSS